MFRSKSEDVLDSSVYKNGKNVKIKKKNFIQKLFNVRQTSQQLRNNTNEQQQRQGQQNSSNNNNNNGDCSTTLLLQRQNIDVSPVRQHRNSVEVLSDQQQQHQQQQHQQQQHQHQHQQQQQQHQQQHQPPFNKSVKIEESQKKKKHFLTKLFSKKSKQPKKEQVQQNTQSANHLTPRPAFHPITSTTTSDASTQWSPGTDDENIAGKNVSIESVHQEIFNDVFQKIKHEERTETETETIYLEKTESAENTSDEIPYLDNIPGTDLLGNPHHVTDDLDKEEMLFKILETLQILEERQMEKDDAQKNTQTFYVPLEYEDGDLNGVKMSNEKKEELKNEILKQLEPQELHERHISNRDESNSTESKTEFLNKTFQTDSLSTTINVFPQTSCPIITSATPASQTTDAKNQDLSIHGRPSDDKIKKLIEAKRKVRDRKQQTETSKPISYFYDINHSDNDDTNHSNSISRDKICDNFNSDYLTGDLNADNGFTDTAFNSYASNTHVKNNRHSNSGSDSSSSSGSCSSYYTDYKNTGSRESVNVTLSPTATNHCLPDILENARSHSEDLKFLTTKFVSLKHLPPTMETLFEESDKGMSDEEGNKMKQNSRIDVRLRFNDFIETTSSEEPFKYSKIILKCAEEANKFSENSNYRLNSLPNLHRNDASTSNFIMSDLTSIRQKLFGRTNSDFLQPQRDDRQHLFRSLSDCPSADQNSGTTRHIDTSKLPYLHSYSHSLAQLSAATRHRFKTPATKTDSYSSQDSHEDLLSSNRSFMTGSLDRLASNSYYNTNNCGISSRRNYLGLKLLTCGNDDNRRHSVVVNSDSPSWESYWKSTKPPQPIPKVALAKLNKDGTPKSILKKTSLSIDE